MFLLSSLAPQVLTPLQSPSQCTRTTVKERKTNRTSRSLNGEVAHCNCDVKSTSDRPLFSSSAMGTKWSETTRRAPRGLQPKQDQHLQILVRCQNLCQQHDIVIGLLSPQIWLVIATGAASESHFPSQTYGHPAALESA